MLSPSGSSIKSSTLATALETLIGDDYAWDGNKNWLDDEQTELEAAATATAHIVTWTGDGAASTTATSTMGKVVSGSLRSHSVLKPATTLQTKLTIKPTPFTLALTL